MAGARIDTDVVVVGGGNAGFAAAQAAAERGRRVVVLEKGAADAAGGNSYFTAGATRIAHDGLDDLLDIVEPIPATPAPSCRRIPATSTPPTWPGSPGGRNDPALTAVLVDEADSAVRWLHGLGMRYRLLYERQAYEGPDGRLVFFGGLHVGNVDGGVGLMADHTAIAARLGVEVRYGTRATDLVTDGGRVVGVRAPVATDRSRWRPLRRARRRRVRGRRRAAPPPPGAGLGARPRTRARRSTPAT